MEAGCNAYVVKPIHTIKLPAMLSGFLVYPTF